MPQTHKLKTMPVYFDAVRRGDKTFEVRRNDRDFQTGDTLLLQKYDPTLLLSAEALASPTPLGFTGDEIRVRVSYVLQGGQFGIAEGHAVLGVHHDLL